MLKASVSFSVLVLACISLLSACGEAAESKHDKAARVLGIEARDNGDYDPSDLSHLLFLHNHATEADKAQGAQFLEAAHDRMLAEPDTFPLVEYFEALLAYPTLSAILGTANGFLRTATRLSRSADPTARSQAGDQYRKAALYYDLTLEFSAATGSTLHDKQHEDIADTIVATLACIERAQASTGASRSDCGEVLDTSLPPALIERNMRSKQ